MPGFFPPWTNGTRASEKIKCPSRRSEPIFIKVSDSINRLGWFLEGITAVHPIGIDCDQGLGGWGEPRGPNFERSKGILHANWTGLIVHWGVWILRRVEVQGTNLSPLCFKTPRFFFFLKDIDERSWGYFSEHFDVRGSFWDTLKYDFLIILNHWCSLSNSFERQIWKD